MNLYFEHPVFDVIQCEKDFYLKVVSEDKGIDHWFNTKLEKYRIPFAPGKENRERTIDINGLDGNKWTLRHLSTEWSESELARMYDCMAGIDSNQIRVIYRGRLLQPGAALSNYDDPDIVNLFHMAIQLRGCHR